jgi:hypothetical protein
MANRQVKFIGYTDTETNASFVFNGVTVFDGSISASGSNATPAELFSFEVDQTLSGNIASSLAVTSGNVTFVTLSFNHYQTIHPDGVDNNGNAIAEVTADDLVNNFEWANSGTGQGAVKKNVEFNGVAFDRSVTGDDTGAGHLDVSSGDTLSCTITTVASPS